MTAITAPASIAPVQVRSIQRPTGWGRGLWDQVPTLDADDPEDDTDESYEYDLELLPTRHRFGKRFLELTTAPDAPLRRRAAGGRDLRWVGWLSLLSAGLVLGGIAWLVVVLK